MGQKRKQNVKTNFALLNNCRRTGIRWVYQSKHLSIVKWLERRTKPESVSFIHVYRKCISHCKWATGTEGGTKRERAKVQIKIHQNVEVIIHIHVNVETAVNWTRWINIWIAQLNIDSFCCYRRADVSEGEELQTALFAFKISPETSVHMPEPRKPRREAEGDRAKSPLTFIESAQERGKQKRIVHGL